MFKSNLHTHTTFSHGFNTMEEMALAAIARNFTSLGISEHAPSVFEDYALPLGRVGDYKQEFYRLREKYKDNIQLYLGMERDVLSDYPADGLDYVIGSVHILRDDMGCLHCVDWQPDMYERGIQKIGGGDVRIFVARYFDAICEMAEVNSPDIIGHMDLIVKLNTNSRFFNEDSGWYRELCANTVTRLAKSGCIIELNTALAGRSGRDIPYPSPFLLERLAVEKAPVTISSDSHRAEDLDFWFRDAVALLKRCGFRTVKQMLDGGFIDVEL